MGSTSKYGRATINPSDPRALGVCDRCGALYNLHQLRFQFQWAGTAMINKQVRVCPTCYDKPSEFLRTIILPPDPPPVWQPRPEPYLVDEVNEIWLRAAGMGVPMFGAASDMRARLTHGSGFAPIILDGVGLLTAFAALGARLAPAVDGVSDMTAAATLGARLAPAVDGVSDVTCELTQVVPVGVVRTFTDSFTVAAANTITDTGTSIGSAASDRLVFVAISGRSNTDAQIISVSVGGIAATAGPQVRRADGAGNFVLSEIWWAAVPTGTTGNTVLTFTGAFFLGGVAVYKVTGADVVAPIASSDTDSVASGDPSISLTIGNDTAVIATAMMGQDSSGQTTAWTNATEDLDFSPSFFGTFVNGGAASRQDAIGPGATNISATVTGATNTNRTMAGVVLEA